MNGREHRGEEHNGTQRARATWVGGRWRRHKRLSVTRRAAQIERLAEEESRLLSVTYAWCMLHNSMTIFKYLRPKLHFSDTRQISSLGTTASREGQCPMRGPKLVCLLPILHRTKTCPINISSARARALLIYGIAS